MTNIPVGSLDPNSEKSKITIRRLLLAKQMFSHGLEHSLITSPLSKMIAIHNFHNAIEIALRAIFLHFEIRPEKELNIGFENMLGEIDKYPEFKAKGVKLPYRQEMRNLNQVRNLVQHHANEPANSTIEDMKVFSRRFLIKVFANFWGCDFDTLNSLDLISDTNAKKLLSLSSEEMIKRDYKKALTLIETTFYWASRNLFNFLPTNTQYHHSVEFSHLSDFSRKLVGVLKDVKSDSNEHFSGLRFRSSHGIGNGFKELDRFAEQLGGSLKRVQDTSVYFAALFTSGVNLVDYKRFKECTPVSYFVGHADRENGEIRQSIDVHWRGYEPNLEDATWAFNFVIDTLYHWQIIGLNPHIRENPDTLAYIKIFLDWDENLNVR